MTSGHPREEPSPGKPHARICEGEAKWPSLLDRDPTLPLPSHVWVPPRAVSAAGNPQAPVPLQSVAPQAPQLAQRLVLRLRALQPRLSRRLQRQVRLNP